MEHQALKYLSEHGPNRPSMQKEMGLVISLRKIINTKEYNPRAKELAREVLNTIVHSTVTPGRTSRHRYFLFDLLKLILSKKQHKRSITVSFNSPKL